MTDQYAAPSVMHFLNQRSLAVRTVAMTATSKTNAFVELRARINTRALELYPDPELLAELRRLRTKYAGGSAGVINPRVDGSHGDRAQALALAVFEQTGGGGNGLPRGGGEGIHVPRALDLSTAAGIRRGRF